MTRNRSNRRGLLFYDLTAAYDRVNIRKLLLKLRRTGVDYYIVRFFADFLTNRLVWSLVDGVESAARRRSKGLTQGAVSSPTLWLIYVDDLLEILSALGLHDRSLDGMAYADDILVGSSPGAPRECAQDLAYATTVIAKWADDNEQRLSERKCKALLISTSTTCKEDKGAYAVPAVARCGTLSTRHHHVPLRSEVKLKQQ